MENNKKIDVMTSVYLHNKAKEAQQSGLTPKEALEQLRQSFAKRTWVN